MIINDNQLPGIRDSRSAFFALGGAGQSTIFWAEQGSKSSGRGGEKVKPVGGEAFSGRCKNTVHVVSPAKFNWFLRTL